MNADKWIEALQHPLMLAGFAFLLAAVVCRLAGNKKRLSDVGKLFFFLILLAMTAVIFLKRNEPSLAIPAFIGLLQVVAGAALNWKPLAGEADYLSTKGAESPAVKAGKDIEIHIGK